MKKATFAAIALALLCSIHASMTRAETGPTLDTFKVTSTSTITPRNASNTLQIPALRGATCIGTNASGTFVNNTGSCGTGGGGGSSTYTVAGGTGVTTTVATSGGNTTTTVTLNINNGNVQTCVSGQLANALTGFGIISCQIAVQTIGGVNTSTVTLIGAGGTNIATTTNSITITTVSTSTANTWTALQTFSLGATVNGPLRLGSTSNALLLVDGSGNVSGFAGSNCSAGQAPTGHSATGTVQNCTAYLTGNQSVTLTVSGDATGTASGATSITDSIQVTGLLGKALPSLATGTLQYSNGAWGFGTPLSYTFAAGAGLSVSQATSAANSTTTYTNTGVTSFAGQGCVTAANSTGTVALTVTCISANQSITFVMAGDATGTASGATSITDSITVTGLNGKALPALASGTLQYTNGAWRISYATSSLGIYDANGNLSSFGGSACSGGQAMNGVSASGTATGCFTPSGSLSGGQANYLAKWLTPSTQGTSTAYNAPSGIQIGTTTDSGLFNVVNSSNTPVFTVATTTTPDNLFAVQTSSSVNIFTVSSGSVGTMVGTFSVTQTSTFAGVSATAVTINGFPASTSTPSSLAGPYLGVSGNSLTPSSTLASSTINVTITNPTTTAPAYSMATWDYQRTFVKIGCVNDVGTTTLQFWNTTTITTTTKNADVVSGTLACSVGGASVSSFGSSTLPANFAIVINVTSTAGSPNQTRVYLISTKQ